MLLDFRNVNTLWASVLVETLHRLGLATAVICPGSRSTPLTIAFAQHREIEAIPILDERSGAFFALGIAKRSGLPVVLVCTSGTAGANFYPAVIEAKESRIPLLILTADRPPELRNCHAGQTIDQVKLYGNYPTWQSELATPASELKMLSYLRQTIVHAWERSLFPTPGVVHLNLPLREPLAPLLDPDITKLESTFDPEAFFTGIFNSQKNIHHLFETSEFKLPSLENGIIIAGVAHSSHPKEYCQAIAYLAQLLQYPVLAEALSPLRNYAELNPYLIATYDLILRDRQSSQKLVPKMVIQIGELPTSKELRTWLETTQPQRWIIDPSSENFDPLHGQTIHLQTSIESLIRSLKNSSTIQALPTNNYLKQWCNAEIKVRENIERTMNSLGNVIEGKIAWLLSKTLPANTPIFIANSMPVRDMEFFWMPNNREIIPYFNRGANGIDGNLSTALGIAHRQKSCVMLTGDLALLHDTNGFLIKKHFFGHLTIVLINNNGGGIFEMLPISQFEPLFEDFFATPQDIPFAKLCATYDVEHCAIASWQELEKRLNPLPEEGIRVLEILCDRKNDARWLQETLKKLGHSSN
jgi:2-succinyl-5-enolpyruvyl-6-hydroxy-3-cyclohexene-1-carboxylate synthase